MYININGYIDLNNKKMEENALSKFNMQYLNYISVDDSGNKLSDVTFQDVITAASLAYNNNRQYNLTKDEADESNYYVTVNAYFRDESGIESFKTHLEETVNENSSEWLSENYYNKYKCSRTDIKVSATTGRVYEITFKLE